MRKNFIIILIAILSTSACTFMYQNDFISTENVGPLGDETIIYSVFQTGIDNYRIEFKSVVDADTIKVFDYGINDAKYKKEKSFALQISGDTLFVLSPLTGCKTYHKTKSGHAIIVARTLDMGECND